MVLMRRIMACIGFTGASGFLIYSTTFADPNYAVAAIALASFCNDLVMPHAWASAMDIGGRYAGTVSGAMNFWGNVGGGLGPLMIGYILSWTDNNWNLTFYVSAAIYSGQPLLAVAGSRDSAEQQDGGPLRDREYRLRTYPLIWQKAVGRPSADTLAAARHRGDVRGSPPFRWRARLCAILPRCPGCRSARRLP